MPREECFERIKAEFMCVQVTIPTTIKEVLDLGLETLFSPVDPQKRLTSKEGEAARDAETRENLKRKLRDARKKLKMMNAWKKTFRDADEKDAVALLKISEVKEI